MKRIALILAAGWLISTGVRAALQTGNRAEWRTLAPMPSLRQEISTAVLDGRIYVIAGFNANGGSTNTVEVYDPRSNTWTSAAPFPVATNHNAAATAAGRLYAFGGTTNRCFVYSPQNNNWMEVAAMRFQHGNTPAVAVINDRIYVAGGSGPGMGGNELEVYDPVANTWTLRASMNVERNHTAGGALNGKFYVAGGRPGNDAAAALEVYDPATNQWRRLANLPTPRSGIGAGVVNGELYVFGGEQPRQFNEVEVYHPLTNIWTQLPPMQTPRHGIVGAVIGNVIHLPGGATQQGLGATNINDAYVVNSAATVSAASYAGAGLAGNSIGAVFGAGLATATAVATATPLPTALGGTTVRVTDSTGTTRLAPLFFVSPTQLNGQIPPGTANGFATVLITSSDGRVSTGVLNIVNNAPSLFTANASGTGPAAAVDGITGARAPFNATRAGDEPNIIAFFGTGLGADATDVDDNVNASVQATIDGNPLTVQYAGRAPGFTGLNQWNLVLPTGITPGTHTVNVTRGGARSNDVTIAIR